MAYYPMLGLGASYDRRPPTSAAGLPSCATQAEHDVAHGGCRPATLRGLGAAASSPNGRFGTANPCWVETLPICPTGPATHAPIILDIPNTRRPPTTAYAPPMPTQHAPVIVDIPSTRRPPGAPILLSPPPLPVTSSYPVPPVDTSSMPPLAPPSPPAPTSGGVSTTGLLAMGALAAAGLYMVFHKKKTQAA